MKPVLHPQPVNGPFGDPAVFVDFLYERRALLLDLGDLGALPSRKLLRVSHVFVTHCHMDHFIGFDRLVRVRLERGGTLALFGPAGFIRQVEHRLSGYTWNLLNDDGPDFRIEASEIGEDGSASVARFRSRTRFQPETCEAAPIRDGLILSDSGVRVRAAVLDHGTPCLAYLIEERTHINVWKNSLDELGLPTGSWLRTLKDAILAGEPDDRPVMVPLPGGGGERKISLGLLRKEAVQVVPGQKVAYVVDAAHTPVNVRRILELIRGADLLFIEAFFLHEDEDRARRFSHLTARQAGSLARAADVKRMMPVHISVRYEDRAQEVLDELSAAFRGEGPA